MQLHKKFKLRDVLLIFLRLTAFVMRVFCQAQQFAGVNIDEDLVCDSVDWLIANQRADGALPEVNAVIHREMVVRNSINTLTYLLQKDRICVK